MTFHLDNLGHLVNDQSLLTFTYDQTQLTKIVLSDGSAGSGTFNFDANKHLKTANIVSSDQSGITTVNFTYTYDSNDYPVKIVAHGISSSNTGTTTADYDITADYLTNKDGFIPFVPEATPFTIYFAYSFFLSKHLINKWVIKISGTDEDGSAIPAFTFTQQYTYTFDTNGRLATMVHSGNSKNIFTFSYTGCN